MLATLREWLDHRIGYRKLMDAMLLEHIPGGAKWRYVWGSCLAFVFAIQLVTGVLLMTAYSAGDSTAWSSVYFIQYQMDFGWLIRGLHHFGSQTMVVLLALHMLQVVIAGAHLPPREINWWLGMGLLGVVLGLSLTGYLLPWDQKGYWATQVATNIAGNLPVVGPWLKKVIVGGPAYGHHTLTRFYALHVGILPPLAIVLIIVHLAVFRRHGVTAPKDAEGEGMFWPEQAFRDLIVCLVIFGVMLFLVLHGHGHPVETPPPEPATAGAEAPADPDLYERWAKAGREGLGANLDAPADASQPYPARPEWYFLFLFQLLKYFEGDLMIVGTVIIPQGVGALLFALPLLGYGKRRRLGHIIGVVVMVTLLGCAGALTLLAIGDDLEEPVPRALMTRLATWLVPASAVVFLLFLAVLASLRRGGARTLVYVGGVLLLAVLMLGTGFLTYAAINDQVPPQVAQVVQGNMDESEKEVPEGVKKFREELRLADEHAARAVQLAGRGVPAGGGALLLRNDPQTQFRGVFLKNCAVCHSYGEFPMSAKPLFKTSEQQGFEKAKFTASDLAGFGSKEWIHSFLRGPDQKRFFGRVPHRKGGKVAFGRMAEWVEGKYELAGADGKAALEADFGTIAAWLATHPREKPAKDSPHAEAYQLFKEKYNCLECHTFAGDRVRPGTPNLTGYGSAEWLRLMIRAPGHPQLYGDKNLMPAFRDLEGPLGLLDMQEYAALLKKDLKDVTVLQLSDIHREVLVRYLTHDDRVIFGGDPIAGPPKR